MTRVLVTGSTGFLGGHLIERLLNEGYDVIGLARNKERGMELEEKGVKMYYGDITNPNDLGGISDDFDKVIHLAAILRFHGVKWEDYHKVNIEGTENVINLALRKKVDHIILTSSTEVIGPVKEIPADENTEPNPVYDYGKSKLLMEEMAGKYISEGAPITIIRPTGIYGPRDTYITPSVLRAVKNGTLKRLPGGGNTYIHFAYIENVVEGYIKALENLEKAKGEVFIISNEDYHTYREAFSIIADLLNVEKPKGSIPYSLAYIAVWFMEISDRLRGRDDFVRHVSVLRDMMSNRAYSIEKAKKMLGFRPKYDFKQGMKKTIEWYSEKGML
jgi:nucleoside-diphosphate-sugar epimerase